LLALMEYTGWVKRWYSPTGATITRDVVEGIQADLAAALMATDNCALIIEKLDDLKESVDYIHNKVTDISNTVTDLTLDAAAKDVALAAIAADLVTLSAAVALDSAALAGIAIGVTGIAAGVTALTGTVDEMEEDVDNIETVVTASATEITETGEDVDAIEANVLALMKRATGVTIINNTFVANTYITFSAAASDTTPLEVYARYNALCDALTDWLNYEVLTVQQSLGAPTGDLNDILATISLGAVWFFQAYGSAGYDATTIQTAWASESDRNALICSLVTNLQGLPVTFENFTGALNSFTPANYNQTLLADLVSLALLQYDAFTNLTTVMPAYFETALAANPTGYTCPPCGSDYPWCDIPQTWDFTQLQKIPWIISRGKTIAGQGIVGVTTPDDPYNYSFDLRWYLPEEGCQFYEPNKLRLTLRVQPGVNGQLIVKTFTSPTQTTPAESAYATNGNEQVIDVGLNGLLYQYIRIYVVTNSAYYNFASLATATYAQLKKIQLLA